MLSCYTTGAYRPQKDSNLHHAGVEDPCLVLFGDTDIYLQWDLNPRPLPSEGSALFHLSYTDSTAGRIRTSSTASVVRRFIR